MEKNLRKIDGGVKKIATPRGVVPLTARGRVLRPSYMVSSKGSSTRCGQIVRFLCNKLVSGLKERQTSSNRF